MTHALAWIAAALVACLAAWFVFACAAWWVFLVPPRTVPKLHERIRHPDRVQVERWRCP